MELWTGFILGLVGSIHCAGMCGPLALALPSGGGRTPYWLGRVGYNTGRITAYALLGAVFGLIGKTAALAGMQRWASLAAGGVILLSLLPSVAVHLRWPPLQIVQYGKNMLGTLLRRRSAPAFYWMGVLNGFLPCGLVYVAGASAVGLGSWTRAILYMACFGLGTFPMMFGIGLLGRGVQLSIRSAWQRLIPVCLTVLGVLLVLRGLSLGIPYLSPDLTAGAGAHACH